MALETQHNWRCTCGRSVPTRVDTCHCGALRDQVVRSRRSESSGAEEEAGARRPVLVVIASVVAIAGAWVWYANVRPDIGAAAPVATQPVATQPVMRPPPTATPFAFAEPTPAVPQPAWAPPPRFPPQQPGDLPGGATPDPTPAVAATPAPAETASDMDVLREKAARWRGQYHIVAERITSLEAEISKLEEEDRRTVNIKIWEHPDPKHVYDPNLKTGGERTHERLLAARDELARAKRELDKIADDARRDGVSSGQLY